MRLDTLGPECWVMKPGFGSQRLHIGQPEREIEALLGSPDSITDEYRNEYYYNYPQLGLEIDFGRHGGIVKHLFCFKEGYRGNRRCPMETVHGIRPGDPKAKIVALLGEPMAQGDRRTVSTGDVIPAWFLYATGINFEFDADETVNMITITSQS